MDDIGWDGGGSGDVYRIFYRMVYTLLFFIVVSTILMNIIFGVIIDTFAELRARKVGLARGPCMPAKCRDLSWLTTLCKLSCKSCVS